MKRILQSLVLALLLASPMQARHYSNTPYTYIQPDGTEVNVRLFGDDLYIDAESEDGYTLIKDADNGFVCYALVNSDSTEYASTGIVYKGGDAPKAVKMITSPNARISAESIRRKQNEAANALGRGGATVPTLRSSSELPDTVYGVCLMIDFPDVKFKFSQEQLNTYLNADHGSIDGNARSIKEYFQWISGGKLTYINYLPAKPYTAPYNKEYYAPKDAAEYTASRFLPVVEDALASCSKSTDGFDVGDLSVRDGALVAINIFYAGKCENEWATGLWPHKNSMVFSKIRDSRFKWGARHGYQISDLGDEILSGTFVHENGHLVLGLPDFYSYDGHEDNNAKKYNIGDSFWNKDEKAPAFPNPYSLDELGWLNNKVVLNDINDGRKVHLEHGPGNAAVYYGQGWNSNERYYLEIRDNHFANWYPSNTKGIFIWHVNTDGDNRYEGKTELLDCRPATDSEPFWSSKSPSKEFSDNSNPSAKWNNGQNSGLYLWDFSKPDLYMTFRCGEYSLKDLVIADDSLPTIKAGDTLNYQLNIEGGDGDYFVILVPTFIMPDWYTVSEDGLFTAYPTAPFAGGIEFMVYDGSDNRASKLLNFRVKEAEAQQDSSESSVRTASNAVLSLYPNPSAGAFSLVSSKSGEAVITNMLGLKVKRIKVEAGCNTFGEDLPKGVYILRFEGYTVRLIKND